MGVLINLAGKQYGYLLVLARAPKPPKTKGRLSWWTVFCLRCRRTLPEPVRSDDLTSGRKRSCVECKTAYQMAGIFIQTITQRGTEHHFESGTESENQSCAFDK